MQDCTGSLYLGKAKLMQKIHKRGPQSSEIFGQKFQWIYHLGKFALVKILEGTLVYIDYGIIHGTTTVFRKASNLPVSAYDSF